MINDGLTTGLDGLQKVCNRLIMLSLPWTGAEYEQIIGRIRRQGSAFGDVEIVIPQIVLDHEGEQWSWDRRRFDLINQKRELADCALDGDIPEKHRITRIDFLRDSRTALDRWIARLGDEGLVAWKRQRLRVPLPPDIRSKVEKRHGDFTKMTQRWAVSKSDTMHDRLQADPSEWYLYHTLYGEARKNWSELPVENLADRLRKRSDWVIGDFGCGECLLGEALPNEIKAFDHVAVNEHVTACDMRKTPCENKSLDAAVFCLSLMGTNWSEYLQEAHRTLKPFGQLLIAEPQKSGRTRQTI